MDFEEENQRLINGIRRWVEIETPSTDALAVNQLVGVVESELSEAGLETERVAGQQGCGDHIIAWTARDSNEMGIMLLGHLDTVWKKGTLKEHPFSIEDGKAYGPGIYDMKAGAYLACEVIKTLKREIDANGNKRPKLPIFMVLVSDEEIGSPTSRNTIEQLAQRAKYVLVVEPARPPNGAAVTSRSGWGRFQLRAKGRAAHAGSDHRKGCNAINEIAHQIIKLQSMTDYARGVTFNVGLVSGGTRSNVVPAEAKAEVDLRFIKATDGAELEKFLYGLKPENPDIRLEVTGGINRPPFERTDKGKELYQKAKDIAYDNGIELGEMAVGGVSDGNFTSALGVATLDGLGAVGSGAHSVNEHIIIDRLSERYNFLTELARKLQ